MRCILWRSSGSLPLAIQFASISVVNVGSGSVVGLSCYIERCAGRDELQDQSFSFSGRGEILASGVLVPENAPSWAQDAQQLWNEATAAEYVTDRKTGEFRLSKHGSPQVAKSYVLALPKELSDADREALVRAYVAEQFSEARVAVQWAIHPDHAGTGNVHAHLLVSTRRLEADGFGKKARELNPDFAFDRTAGRGRVSEQDRVGEKWAEFQNRFFRDRGIDLSVDPTRIVADLNLSSARFVENSDKEQMRAALAERNREAARDPDKALAHLTAREATFTARQVDAFLQKSGLPEVERIATREAIFSRPDLVRLEEVRQTQGGRSVVVERFTLQRIIEQESRVLGEGAALRGRGGHEASQTAWQAAEGSRTLSDEQRAAFRSATGGHGLAIVQGRAGTGKSYTAGAIREAYEHDGFRVIGLAPTNTVAADMRADGFREGRTVASELMRQENGAAPWDRRTVVLVDEMAMLSTKDMDRLLGHARETGAKIVGFGDDRQLASIERGGLFGPLAELAQARELTQVTRQREDWQRLASAAAARGDFRSAIGAYADRNAIGWTETVEDAFKEVRSRWSDEQAAGRSAFVYATTNDSVDRLNVELRQARIDLGQVGREGERSFATEKGDRRIETTISPGDRIQFHATVKDRSEGLELRNGEFGTVVGISGDRLRAHMDDGRLVAFDAAEHRGWGLGYAGTTYKGQGKTNESTILFYDNARAWSSRAAYVNLTRHKDRAHLVVPSGLAPGRKELAQQMSRDDGRRAAIAYRRAPERPAPERAAAPMEPEREAQRRAASQSRPAAPPAAPNLRARQDVEATQARSADPSNDRLDAALALAGSILSRAVVGATPGHAGAAGANPLPGPSAEIESGVRQAASAFEAERGLAAARDAFAAVREAQKLAEQARIEAQRAKDVEIARQKQQEIERARQLERSRGPILGM